MHWLWQTQVPLYISPGSVFFPLCLCVHAHSTCGCKIWTNNGYKEYAPFFFPPCKLRFIISQISWLNRITVWLPKISLLLPTGFWRAFSLSLLWVSIAGFKMKKDSHLFLKVGGWEEPASPHFDIKGLFSRSLQPNKNLSGCKPKVTFWWVSPTEHHGSS